MSHIIKIFPSNIEFSGREDESILDAALSAGIHLEHSCKAGDCGICESDLLAGEVVDSKGNIFGQGDKILTCCCKPKTALELNAHFFPELAGQTKKIVPCKVNSAVLVSGDVMTLKLRTPPTAKIGFLPGQYINLHYKGVSKHHCRSVTVVPSFRGLPLYNTDMSFIFSHEVMLLRIQNNLAKRSSRFLKRTFDIVCSIMILIIASPLMIYLWYKVTRDGGPAIYGHQRVGRHGKLFPCYKFRSMVMNSQEVLKELLANDPIARAEWEKDFKLKNDPRITAVGRFIRKTSLDELPQLFNVLKGDMSLVGPRPIVSDELERYCDDVDYYLMAKPGMTGLWQVSGRNDVDYDTRVYFDSWYVKNWTLWNDIAILFKTAKVVLRRDGAY